MSFAALAASAGFASGSSAGFPDPPTGSPAEIGGIARSLNAAAGELEQAEAGLGGAAGVLAGDWQGYAAGAYQSSSGALAFAARGAAETFGGCAGALSGYASVLEQTQSEMGRLRRFYEDAKSRQAVAQSTATGLAAQLAAATKHAELDALNSQLTRASGHALDAGDEAAGYARRASELLDEFHRQESRCMQALAGEQAPGGRPLPQGSPFNPLFHVVGEAGAGFGLPFTAAFGGLTPGGLQAFDGVIPVGDPWNSPIPGYGTYMDALHGNATSPDDLTNAIEMVVAPGIGSAVEDGLTDGVRVAAGIIEDGARATGAAEAVAKGVQDASGSAAEDVEPAIHVVERELPAELRQFGDTIEYRNGQPDFSPFADKTVQIEYTGSRRLDYAAADDAAGITEAYRNGDNPLGIQYTWHHDYDCTTMQLVPRSLHRALGHAGGFSYFMNGLC